MTPHNHPADQCERRILFTLRMHGVVTFLLIGAGSFLILTACYALLVSLDWGPDQLLLYARGSIITLSLALLIAFTRNMRMSKLRPQARKNMRELFPEATHYLDSWWSTDLASHDDEAVRAILGDRLARALPASHDDEAARAILGDRLAGALPASLDQPLRYRSHKLRAAAIMIATLGLLTLLPHGFDPSRRYCERLIGTPDIQPLATTVILPESTWISAKHDVEIEIEFDRPIEGQPELIVTGADGTTTERPLEPTGSGTYRTVIPAHKTNFSTSFRVSERTSPPLLFSILPDTGVVLRQIRKNSLQGVQTIGPDTFPLTVPAGTVLEFELEKQPGPMLGFGMSCDTIGDIPMQQRNEPDIYIIRQTITQDVAFTTYWQYQGAPIGRGEPLLVRCLKDVPPIIRLISPLDGTDYDPEPNSIQITATVVDPGGIESAHLLYTDYGQMTQTIPVKLSQQADGSYAIDHKLDMASLPPRRGRLLGICVAVTDKSPEPKTIYSDISNLVLPPKGDIADQDQQLQDFWDKIIANGVPENPDQPYDHQEPADQLAANTPPPEQQAAKHPNEKKPAPPEDPQALPTPNAEAATEPPAPEQKPEQQVAEHPDEKKPAPPEDPQAQPTPDAETTTEPPAPEQKPEQQVAEHPDEKKPAPPKDPQALPTPNAEAATEPPAPEQKPEQQVAEHPDEKKPAPPEDPQAPPTPEAETTTEPPAPEQKPEGPKATEPPPSDADKPKPAPKKQDPPCKSCGKPKASDKDCGSCDKPGESKPGESKTGESKPGESKPGESKPGESKPGESKPGETKPGESKPGESKTGESKPGETKPGESKPGESKPGESKPGESKPGETKPGETKPGETKPGETKPGESKPSETKPDETKPGETKPGETKPDETKPGETKPGESKEPKPEPTAQEPQRAQEQKPKDNQEPRPAPKKPCKSCGNPKATDKECGSCDKPGGSKPGQSKPGESKPGQSKPGESKPGQSKPGESKPPASKPQPTPAPQKPPAEQQQQQQQQQQANQNSDPNGPGGKTNIAPGTSEGQVDPIALNPDTFNNLQANADDTGDKIEIENSDKTTLDVTSGAAKQKNADDLSPLSQRPETPGEKNAQKSLELTNLSKGVSTTGRKLAGIKKGEFINRPATGINRLKSSSREKVIQSYTPRLDTLTHQERRALEEYYKQLRDIK